ncbi:MAG: acetyl-CoA hydrolase/transferase C-terminal domain-containing protein [Oceanicaulis sp.]
MATAPVSLSPEQLAERLRAALPARARVYVPGVAAEPYGLAGAFGDQPGLADGLTFFGVWIPGVNRTDWSALSDTSRFETLFLAPELRAGFEAGRIAFLPITYTRAWRWLETAPVDGAILQVAPPDEHGNCSLSLASDFTPAIWERATVRVAQINPALPVMPGAPSIPLSAFDAVCELETEPRGYDAGSLPPVFQQIAETIAALVDDGASVQFGLGKVQLAVLPALKHHRGLTIHSGMVSDPLLQILDGDTVAAIRTGAVLGSRALADALQDDPRLQMTPVNRTHAMSVLSGLAKFTAINSVIEVDLFGQANAEFVGGRQVSGGGGLVDFARGAQGSPGGKAIFALASTAKGGSISRIVPRLAPDATTLTRADVEIVVTEHGAADLRGLSLDARAQALIDIAHPEHRAGLEKAWADMRRSL